MGLKSVARQLTSRVVSRFGYELVDTSRRSLGDPGSVAGLARHLRELFTAVGITHVIDVGANEGQYYRFLRDDVAWMGPVLSFEPNPELAAHLRRQARQDPQWTVMDCALGREASTMTLNIMTRSGWTSLLPKRAEALTDRADGFDVARSVPVSVRALDDVLRDLSGWGRACPYVKIDAQGFDLEVLSGATRTLDRAGALQTELELLPVYDGAPDYRDVLAFLQARQYAVTGVYPVWWDSSLRIGEMDTVLRNMRLTNGGTGDDGTTTA